MTREELREHCEKQMEMCEMCEMWAISKGEKPSGKIYEEHKLILELLEQEPILDKIRAEIEDMKAPDYGFAGFEDFYMCQSEVLQIIDKYRAENEG